MLQLAILHIKSNTIFSFFIRKLFLDFKTIWKFQKSSPDKFHFALVIEYANSSYSTKVHKKLMIGRLEYIKLDASYNFDNLFFGTIFFTAVAGITGRG